jgi:hypothetical protein
MYHFRPPIGKRFSALYGFKANWHRVIAVLNDEWIWSTFEQMNNDVEPYANYTNSSFFTPDVFIAKRLPVAR